MRDVAGKIEEPTTPRATSASGLRTLFGSRAALSSRKQGK